MRLALFIASGLEECEALITVDLLRRANIHVDMVSIDNESTVQGSHNISIVVDTTINEINIDEYTGIILPGGMPGTTNLANCMLLEKYLLKFNSENKLICAICAAPSILLKLGILDNKEYTCYPSYENSDLSAIYTDKPYVISDNIITAKALGCSFDFTLAIISKLLSPTAANDIKNEIFA